MKLPSFGKGSSPLSKMSTQQQLQTLGAAFSGDQGQLAQMLAMTQGGGQGGGAGGVMPPEMAQQFGGAPDPMAGAAQDLISRLGGDGLGPMERRQRPRLGFGFGYGGR
jgi:hypothetical protein